MYLVWINPPTNFTFSDDSVFLKKNLGGGHKFSIFACYYLDLNIQLILAILIFMNILTFMLG